MNSHSFQQTDIFGEHMTTYNRIPKENSKFNEKSIFSWMKEQNPDVFLEEYDKSYTFDGDTIEFMTQPFYKTTVSNVINELIGIERDFICALNSLPREGLFKLYAPFQIAQKNYPFASYITNLENNAMFNNGTIHINITLPTKLDEEAQIANFEEFRTKHQNLARVLQWISPLLIAVYGAYDPLCKSKTNGNLFAAGSQRVAVSRYIGLGTYDTDKMEKGKILTRHKSELSNKLSWYDEFHKRVSLKYLDELGMDINFNKHFAHGIEFRILDALPIRDLEEVLKFIIYLADFSLENNVSNPINTSLWNRLALNCVHDGKGYYMDVSDQNELFKIFKINYISKEPLQAVDILDILINSLKIKYKDGLCVSLMINCDNSILNPVHTQQHLLTLFVLTLPTIKEESYLSRESRATSTDRIESLPVVSSSPSNTPPMSPNHCTTPVQDIRRDVLEVPKKRSIWCC